MVSGFAYSVTGRVVMNRCNSKIKVDRRNKNDWEDISGAKHFYTSFSKLAGTKLTEPRRRRCTIIGAYIRASQSLRTWTLSPSFALVNFSPSAVITSCVLFNWWPTFFLVFYVFVRAGDNSQTVFNIFSIPPPRRCHSLLLGSTCHPPQLSPFSVPVDLLREKST